MITNPVIPQFELGTLIGNLIAVFIIVAAILTFLYLILGGLQWITSSGEKAGLEQARNRITHAFIGLFIVTAAWAIMTLTANFFGFPFPTISIPELGKERQVVVQRCLDNQGNPGQECSNLNHCTNNGDCDPECCVTFGDCPPILSECVEGGYRCKSGRHCLP